MENVFDVLKERGLIAQTTHEDEIRELLGKEKVTFAPNASITRAEAMTIIARMLGTNGSAQIAFADGADIPAWAADGINALVSGGIVNGYEDGTIRPNNNVTRAEAAAMMLNVKNNE